MLAVHQREQKELLDAALAGAVPHVVHSLNRRVAVQAQTDHEAVKSEVPVYDDLKLAVVRARNLSATS
jgi:hypothetical protein